MNQQIQIIPIPMSNSKEDAGVYGWFLIWVCLSIAIFFGMEWLASWSLRRPKKYCGLPPNDGSTRRAP